MPFFPASSKGQIFSSSPFNICAKPVSNTIKCYRLKFLPYADGAQLYVLLNQETENTVIQIVIACKNKASAKSQ